MNDATARSGLEAGVPDRCAGVLDEAPKRRLPLEEWLHPSLEARLRAEGVPYRRQTASVLEAKIWLGSAAMVLIAFRAIASLLSWFLVSCPG